jgi:hypothetical protein
MTTGTKFDVLGEYDGQPFRFARNLFLTTEIIMVGNKKTKYMKKGGLVKKMKKTKYKKKGGKKRR